MPRSAYRLGHCVGLTAGSETNKVRWLWLPPAPPCHWRLLSTLDLPLKSRKVRKQRMLSGPPDHVNAMSRTALWSWGWIMASGCTCGSA